jgi:hypothetical protein
LTGEGEGRKVGGPERCFQEENGSQRVPGPDVIERGFGDKDIEN